MPINAYKILLGGDPVGKALITRYALAVPEGKFSRCVVYKIFNAKVIKVRFFHHLSKPYFVNSVNPQGNSKSPDDTTDTIFFDLLTLHQADEQQEDACYFP
jgi:hypothetical protein